MPWELRVLQQRLERLSAHQVEAWSPAIDVYETETSFVVTAEVPGLTREQVDLVFEDRRLTIRGSRSDRAAQGDVVRFHQVERGHGSFPGPSSSPTGLTSTASSPTSRMVS